MVNVPNRFLVTYEEAVGIAIDILEYIEENPDAAEALVHCPAVILAWMKRSIGTYVDLPKQDSS